MAQITAVEWLINWSKENQVAFQSDYYEAIEQAKAMEKEQIKDAYWNGTVDMEKQEIGDYFPEFFALKDQCKFNNCLHKDEPHCAIKNALENDEIAWSRYKSYTQILEGDEEQYRADIYDAERRASDETRKS